MLIIIGMGLIISFLLIALAMHLIVKTIIGPESGFEIAEEKKVFPSPILKWMYPIMNRLEPSIREWKIDKFRAKFRKVLASAGMRDSLTVDEVYAWQIAMAFAIPCTAYLLNIMMDLGVKISHLPFMIIGGWFYPRLWLDGIIKNRRQIIKQELPFVMDLLTLSVEAGLDFPGAMGKVVEKGQKGPMRDEIEQALKEIKIGASRAEALKNMGERIGLRELSSFVSILVTAEKMGSPIGEVLRAQADTMRQVRFMDAEKKGGQASTKVLIPMVFFILPAVFIVIFGPIILGKIYGDGG